MTHQRGSSVFCGGAPHAAALRHGTRLRHADASTANHRSADLVANNRQRRGRGLGSLESRSPGQFELDPPPTRLWQPRNGSLNHRRNNSGQSVSDIADRNEACCDCQNKERCDHCVGHVSARNWVTGIDWQRWEINASMLLSYGCA
jgi:hypothetical protein